MEGDQSPRRRARTLGDGGADPPFYGHGTKQQTYRDPRTLGKATIVVVNRKRYRCRSCSATFMQDLLEMDDAHQATARLVEYVMK